MALGGAAPLLVFSLLPPGIGAAVNSLIPFLPVDVAGLLGIPIPIYLDEKLTGVYVDSETRNIDMDTQSQQLRTGLVQVDQRGVSNTVSVNMFGKTDSVLLCALLAVSDILFALAASKSYTVSYFNGPTVVLGGLLHGFNTSREFNDDLIRITLSLSKSNVSAGLGAAGAIAGLAAATPRALDKVRASLPTPGELIA